MSEFKQHPVYTNYYVSKNGTFYYFNKSGKKSDVTHGTAVKNKYGSFLQYEACVTIAKNKYKVVNVARLVLETFVGLQPADNYEVCHIDRNPLNNNVSNLTWITHEENIKLRTRQWTDERRTKRANTAKRLGYNSWSDLLKAARSAKKQQKEAQCQTL